MQTFETEHYIFSYIKDSLAEREIQSIAREQEYCYKKICGILDMTFPHKIKYFLYDSPYTIGKYLCDDPECWCCGMAVTSETGSADKTISSLRFEGGDWFEVPAHSVHAVYNERIKATGAHEDTHVISAMINDFAAAFLCEGLAQYIEGKWHGRSNEYQAKLLYTTGKIIKPSEAMKLTEDEFYELDYQTAYPYAGAWVKFFADNHGIDLFKHIYSCNDSLVEEIEKCTGVSVIKLDKAFFTWLMGEEE